MICYKNSQYSRDINQQDNYLAIERLKTDNGNAQTLYLQLFFPVGEEPHPYDFQSEIDIDVILKHLSGSIEKIISELSDLSELSDSKISLYGPYLGRSVLELSMTALLARLDPFRILVIKGRQAQPGYELNKPNSSAIRWQGDVIDKAVNNLWDD